MPISKDIKHVNILKYLVMLKLLSVLILTYAINTLGYSQQEAEIYNQVINDFAINENLKNTDSNNEVTIVALEKPSRIFKEVTFYRLRQSYRKLNEDVFNDFYKKNQMDFRLEEFYTSNFELIIVSKEAISTQERIAEKYPKWNHAIIELSNIGFNKSKNEAMVYYGQHIVSRSAGGVYIIYKLKKGKWKRKKIIASWSA